MKYRRITFAAAVISALSQISLHAAADAKTAPNPTTPTAYSGEPASVASAGVRAPVPANRIPAFVYEGAGCTGLAALPQFEAVIGRKVDGVTDFLDDSSDWPNLVSETNWALGCWQGAVSNVDVSLPMVVVQHDKSALHELAEGQFDAYFVQVAQSLVSHGFPNAFVRIGWEFNGSWFPWAGDASPAMWAKGFRHVVRAMRSVPGQHFRFVWNPALYEGQFSPDQAYPGDDAVDVIATDAYNESWDPGYTIPASLWNSVDNDNWGVAQVVSFAQQHNKRVAFPEWGTGTRPDGHGGGDDPLFIANMAATMAATSVAFQSYWDYPASDYNAQISSGQYPGALAAFMTAFGSLSSGSSSKIAAVKRTGSIVTANAAPAQTSGGRPVTVSATGCSEVTLDNGAGHYELIVFDAYRTGTTSAQATAKCELSWNVASEAKLYDPGVGSAPVTDFGSSKSVTLSLKAKRPLIVTLTE